MSFARFFVKRITAPPGAPPDARAAALRRPLALAGVALLAACFRYAPMYAAGPEPNQALPDVTFRTSQDETVRTDDMKGDVVFVDLWTTNCKGCAAMRAAAKRLNQRFVAQGVRFLGVNEDPEQQTWKTYLVQNPSPLIEVWDKSHSFRAAMHLTGVPAAFVVDRSGQVRWSSPRWNDAAEAQASSQMEGLLKEPPPK
jgi:cytochrome c biogenesis protein CcmG/thiol:disulfide interchange protein DsbE